MVRPELLDHQLLQASVAVAARQRERPEQWAGRVFFGRHHPVGCGGRLIGVAGHSYASRPTPVGPGDTARRSTANSRSLVAPWNTRPRVTVQVVTLEARGGFPRPCPPL